ncbi:MAG: MFS transporter [Thermodesulfovibrionales bacterium]|nr:MFS transporter [Thermodesulfovibrionales bacterium]
MQSRYRFSALYLRDFRVFWFSQLLSLSGTWMHAAAQSWLVYLLTKSPFYLGLIAALSSFPILFFTLIGGMVADRHPKRDILIVTQVLSIIPALSIAILIDLKVIEIWHIGFLAFFLGLVNAFDVPARHAFVGELVGKADITNAIALNSVAFNGARIVGPLAAGFVITMVSLQTCFYINALTFIPVIIALFSIKSKGVTRLQKEGYLIGIKDAWHFIIQERAVLYIMFLIAIFSLLGIPYITLLPIIASEILKVGAKEFSILLACVGVGSLSAALSIAYRGEIGRKEDYLKVSGLVFSCSLIGLSNTELFLLSCIFITLAGYGFTSFLATSNIFIQHLVPDSLRGRVMSFYTLVFLGFLPIGNSITGYTADILGTQTTLRIFSGFCLLCSIIFILKIKSTKTLK